MIRWAQSWSPESRFTSWAFSIHYLHDIIHIMNPTAVGILPIFRSRHQLDLLTHLFLNTGRPRSVADIARATRVPQPTVSREVARLEKAGLVTVQLQGRSKLVQANPLNPFFADLRSLLLKATGPGSVIGHYLKKVTDIESAFIFGSWARRYDGEFGRYPEDIDVLVIGDPSPEDVDEACRRASRKLGFAVSPVIALPSEWRNAASGFLKQLKREPLVQILPVGEYAKR